MSRPGTRRRLRETRLVRREFRSLRIEAVTENLVEAEISRENEAVVGADDDAVRVGTFLALGIDARSFVLNEGRRLAE